MIGRTLPWRDLGVTGAALLAGALLAIAGGRIVAAGNLLAVVSMLCVLVGIALVTRPAWLLWFAVVGAMIITGFTQLYLPQLQLVRWLVALLTAGLAALALLHLAFASPVARPARLSPVFWYLLAFLLLAALSAVANYVDAATLMYGLKGYFQVYGLFMALVLFPWAPAVIDRIPKVVVAIAFVQIPFVIHQYLFLVPRRTGLAQNIVAEDVVAGTMGAEALGGGANAVLSLLMLTAMAILTASFKQGRQNVASFAVAVVILVSPILLNANKVAILYFILLYLLLFGGDLIHKPLRFAFGMTLGALIIVAIVWSYTSVLSTAERAPSWEALVETMVEKNTSETGHGEHLLNRGSVLPYWLQEHAKGPALNIVLGHGPGQTREGGMMGASTLADGDYAGVGIGLTSLSALLWEVGIAGLMVVLFALVAAWRAAGRLAQVHSDHQQRSGVFIALRPVLLIFGLSLFHKNLLVFHLPYQTLLLIILGYIAYWDSRAPAAGEEISN